MSADGSRLAVEPVAPAATVDLYVVQKCWFAGPVVSAAVDYLRLLTTSKDAEQVAYQSAHLYNNSVNRNSSRGGPVRTIQLPHSPHYGFVAAGQLFWVRSVPAASTVPLPPQGWRCGEAHCLVTDGILSGEGRNASHRRRGFASSTAEALVYVGPHSSHAALRLAARAGSVAAGSTVQWVPVGQPSTVAQLTREWPDSATWHPHHHSSSSSSVATVADVGMDETSSSILSSTKRVVSDAENSWFSGGGGCARGTGEVVAAAEKEHRMMMDSPSPPRPTKRACRTTSATHAAFLNAITIQHGVTQLHSNARNMEH